MSYLRLLRQRSVLVLWLAQSLSVLGDRLYALAVMWVVYAATGSASLMGLVAVVESLPYVVLGTAGRHAVARFSTFGRLAWVDAARALVTVALPLLWSPDARGVALLLVGVLLLGTLGALFDPNLGALVPDLVELERVQQVTGFFDLTGRIARTAGPGERPPRVPRTAACLGLPSACGPQLVGRRGFATDRLPVRGVIVRDS
ncbi:MFS transporter [Streptomyces cinnamoneus]|uniref:MFS transporter n=1 Tax=Streptomyces cinnamoneus TaxID=53446 RepID=UPI0033C7C52F